MLGAMSTSLRSNQWSCSELAKGAQVCAQMAGMDLSVDPSTLSEEDLLKAIEDPIFHMVLHQQFRRSHPGQHDFTKLKLDHGKYHSIRFNSRLQCETSIYPSSPGSQEDHPDWSTSSNSECSIYAN